MILSKKLILPALTPVIFAILFYSCKPVQKAVQKNPENVRHKGTKNILEQFRTNNSGFTWLTGKINAKVTHEERIYSFNVSMSIKRDSLIWISVSTGPGIEVARALLLEDTLKFLNRLNETYLISDFDSLNRFFNTDVNFNSIQSLLTATDLSYFLDVEEGDTLNGTDEIRFRSAVDGDYYFLGTISKRKLRKTSHRKKEIRVKHKIQKKDPDMGYIQGIWIYPDNYKAAKFILDELKTGRKLLVNYSNYMNSGDALFPGKISYELLSSETFSLQMEFSRLSNAPPQSVRFTIPQKYTPMQ
ncbi:MAG: DUF4292 domain-containing protein [Bacteroidetes bacterium]|nr:DUF4292 domain-containing protein [Bacteroidota bacterium]